MSTSRSQIAAANRIVVKIGSALLTDDGRGLNVELITELVAQMAALRTAGKEIIVVSSGAVAAGMTRLNRSDRPESLNELQAMAAIGQMRLIQTWEAAFFEHGLSTAQVLLTHADVKNRQRYLNAQGTLRALLDLQVVPVINENDTVATDEMRLGDNDTLAGLVANLVDAQAVVILTDQLGMFDSDPRHNPNAMLLDNLAVDNPALMKMAGGSGALGRGGMRTKVLAAQHAAYSGAYTVIASGKEVNVLKRIGAGEAVGSLFVPAEKPLNARKQWIAAQGVGEGILVCDAGAKRALQKGGCSLLPAGLLAVEGEFQRGDCVQCVDTEGEVIAIGLSNYNSDEAAKLCGVNSDDISAQLGYASASELIHCDNLLLMV